jgi:hypothetical protein
MIPSIFLSMQASQKASVKPVEPVNSTSFKVRNFSQDPRVVTS